MDKTVYIENIPSIELGGQTYQSSDTALISSFDTENAFDSTVNYIEYHIYNGNKFLIDTIENLDSYRIYNNQVYIDPEQDLESRVFQPGQYYSVYNFLTPVLSSSFQETFYISEISTDRTELRLASTDILGGDIIDSTEALKTLIDSSPYYQDFYLNFGNNNLVIANNILLDDSDPENITVLIKLYEPLADSFQLNSQCWAVQKIAESLAYLFNVQMSFDSVDELIRIKGPNTNILALESGNKSTEIVASSDLLYTTEDSLKNQLQSYLQEAGSDLNIDYSEYTNFVFFSKAETRLENFYYKLGLIEEYAYSASLYTDTTNFYNSGSSTYWESKLKEVITNFDGYEYYLYFESGSTTWPKSNSTPPYTNYPTTSSQAVAWLNTQLATASIYDTENKDSLINSVPLYIRENSDNLNYLLFVEMAGQHFDDIWLYIQAVTEKYNNINGVNKGLSKDLVGIALRDFGIKLYQNNFTSDNLYSTYLGITPSGSLLPYTGQELINTYVTASATGSLIPVNDLSSEIHKRLYHNLPLLVKKKGTAAGLRILANIYGVPASILRINEFGGKDKNTNTWDYWQNTFDYSFNTQGINYLTSSFAVNTAWGAINNVPSAVEFKFKTTGLPAASNYSQSLWATDKNVGLRLKYTGTGLTSGSYSGSIVDPYFEYGYLEFFPDITDLNSSASIYLPFFDGGWWSVLVNKNSNSDYTLYVGNSLYSGNDGNTLGFTSNSTVNKLGNWSGSAVSYFGTSSLNASTFSGSLQEIRYYKNALSQSVFNDFIMNGSSIEGNGINSAPDQLIFRASLGGELYTSSISIHPKISGEWVTTSSFASDSTFYFNTTPVFTANNLISFYDQPVTGIKNPVSDKINIQGKTVYGNVLSTLTTLQQSYPASSSFTRDVNYLEVGYSPQNEINEDITDSIGYFNIGDYIGDPRQFSSSTLSYPELDSLRDSYFEKYNKSYDYQDYFRLIKFYDNSLFKLIKDFIPARTAAATGAIVKQHLLERNRQRSAQITYSEPYYTASVTSLPRDYETGSIGVFDGGSGGSVNQWVNISQSYTASVLGLAGLVTFIESSEYEFYNGQYSGSNIECQLSHSINTTPLLNNVSSSRLSTVYEDVDYNSDALNPTNLPFIQSGSAFKAAVQDSNYASGSVWNIPRYEGSENTGQYNYTINFPSTSIAPGYPIDDFSEYIAYFDWVGGSDPQYPGGGNVHIISLIKTDGTVIGLDTANKNLDIVEKIFKAGTSPTIYIQTYSSIEPTTPTTVVEGGALYQTIMFGTGSDIRGISVESNGNNNAVNVLFTTSSINTLVDSASIAGGDNGLYALQTGTASVGIIDLIGSISDGVGIYNNTLGSIAGQNGTSLYFPYRDSLFPLKYGDFIRFGTTGSYSQNNIYALDGTFQASGLLQIKQINLGPSPVSTSSIEVTPVITGHITGSLQTPFNGSYVNQNYRIFRRIPNETFILIQNKPVNPGAGVIVPHNFNPNYDPIQLARQVGLI